MQFVDNLAKCIFRTGQKTLHSDKQAFHCNGFSTVSNGQKSPPG